MLSFALQMQCKGNSWAKLYTTSSPNGYVDVASPDEASLWQMLCMHRERILTQMGYGLSNIHTSELEGIMKGMSCQGSQGSFVAEVQTQ